RGAPGAPVECCLTIRTGGEALAATALEMLPSISRFHPVRPCEPRMIRSQASASAVCRMVAGMFPHLRRVIEATPTRVAYVAALSKGSLPSCSTLSISMSNSIPASGVSYDTGIVNTLKIHTPASVPAARGLAQPTSASDHGLPPVATSMRLYMTLLLSMPPSIPGGALAGHAIGSGGRRAGGNLHRYPIIRLHRSE